MKLQTSLKPQHYFQHYNFATLNVPAFSGISDLERAIAGYVISCEVIKQDGTRYKKSASYPELSELVFEFYKIFYPKIARRFIRQTREFVENFYFAASKDGLSEKYLSDISALVEHLRRLERVPVKKISYKDYESNKLDDLLFQQSPPLKTYVRNILTNLRILGLFSTRTARGSKYVTINPKLKFNWPKKKK